MKICKNAYPIIERTKSTLEKLNENTGMTTPTSEYMLTYLRLSLNPTLKIIIIIKSAND